MSLLAVSHRKQSQPSDCLAACAAMVLEFIGIKTDYKRILERVRTSSYGAPFRNLEYLESLGVQVLIARGEIETLQQYLERGVPPIAFVNTGQLGYWNEVNNHAVVVVGIEGRQIFLDDPALPDAPKTASIDEFMLAWIDMDQFYSVIVRK